MLDQDLHLINVKVNEIHSVQFRDDRLSIRFGDRVISQDIFRINEDHLPPKAQELIFQVRETLTSFCHIVNHEIQKGVT
jgi:hypothetical protein